MANNTRGVGFEIPDSWPKWNKVCGAKRRKGAGTCRLKAVIGCKRCRFHGSGGEKAKELGILKYLAWIIVGQNIEMPVEQACTIAFAVFAEAVLKNGAGTVDQQIKAALWMTQALDKS